MADVSLSATTKTCASGGDAGCRAARWLSLAAAPTFAILALATGLFDDEPRMLCMGMAGHWPLNGMALMYTLMSVFHAAPWLTLISIRSIIAPGS